MKDSVLDVMAFDDNNNWLRYRVQKEGLQRRKKNHLKIKSSADKIESNKIKNDYNRAPSNSINKIHQQQ